MALSTRLQLKQSQSQSLVMTPQLVQSIKLLQLSNVELAAFVREELEKNPLLELEPEVPDISRRSNQDEHVVLSATGTESSNGVRDASEVVSSEMPLDAARLEKDIDASFENVYDGDNSGINRDHLSYLGHSQDSASRAGNPGQDHDFLARIGERESLVRHLETQIACAFAKTAERAIAFEIAHSLDEDGYFRDDCAETAQRLGIETRQFLKILAHFQEFEPAGIGARNLAECLILQLKDNNRFDPAMACLMENLDLLAKREFAVLEKRCRVSREDLNEMIREIKALDPRPAAQYEPLLAEPVIPDVLVQQNTAGGWAIELNPDALPRVLMNRQYCQELTSRIDTSEGREFIADCLNTANWLTRSLDQRAQTILKVAIEIVRQQDMFFARGVEHLRPLNLKTVADAIKMHESTVSRVTSNKFIMCERGVFELKYFFSTAIQATDDAPVHSSETVRYKIRRLIDNERHDMILSDDAIVTRLKEDGIDIARRTVAKYRESMKIPSSVQRRREKRCMAESAAQ